MKGLLQKPSLHAADAREALRVIDYFDTLVNRGASPAALVRAAAGLAECDVTWRRGDGSIISTQGSEQDGTDTSTGARGPDACAQVLGDGEVALHRRGPPRTLDPLLLERLAIAATAIVNNRTAVGGEAARCLRRMLDELTTPINRIGAADRLGLDAYRPVVVLAAARRDVRGPVDLGAAFAQVLHRVQPRRSKAMTTTGVGTSAVLVGLVQLDTGASSLESLIRSTPATNDATAADTAIRVGSARADHVGVVPSALHNALAGLRFALVDVHGRDASVVEYESLGLLASLAGQPVDELNTHHDVEQIRALSRTDRTPSNVDVLESFCRTGSLRHAAAELHMHHSTVGSRIAQLGRITGWALASPIGRQRAHLAVIAYRLSSLPAL